MKIIETKRARKRHQLTHDGPPRVPEHLRIKTLPSLHHHLQTAIELEHSTIPPYLTALYSIDEGTNQESAAILRSVVMEEMLHLILAANVLNAVGGHPSVNHARFVPEYPTYLPHSSKSFLVNLQRFSPAAIDTFLQIERPQKPLAPPEANDYQTIGQFYEAIELALIELSAQGDIFTGDPKRQITPEYYYGSGGEVTPVGAGWGKPTLTSALEALHEIMGQGEGIDDTIFDGDHEMFGQEIEIAHYFRFNQIHCGRYYTLKDTPRSGPTGRPLAVDDKAVHNMQENPKMSDYPRGSELWQKSYAFNRAYRGLLDVLHDALNGRPARLLESVPRMYDLKYLATSLMQVPLPGTDKTAGPSFEFVAD